MEIKRKAQEVVSFHLDAGGDSWLQRQLVLPSGHTKLFSSFHIIFSVQSFFTSFSLGSHLLKAETGAVFGRCFGLSASVRDSYLQIHTESDAQLRSLF